MNKSSLNYVKPRLNAQLLKIAFNGTLSEQDVIKASVKALQNKQIIEILPVPVQV